MKKRTEAQIVAEQNAQGWKQTPWPSKTLAVVSLVCFVAFCTIAILWAFDQGNAGNVQSRHDDLLEAKWVNEETIGLQNQMIQGLMRELGWPVEGGWYYYCLERLGIGIPD